MLQGLVSMLLTRGATDTDGAAALCTSEAIRVMLGASDKAQGAAPTSPLTVPWPDMKTVTRVLASHANGSQVCFDG